MKHIILAVALFANSATAHEMTPTYLKFKSSYIEGVAVSTIEMWNRRNDVEYYEISVVDNMWNDIPFATKSKIVKLSHLSRSKIDIYVKKEDIDNIEFVCTSSKQLKSDVISTGVKSMICSKIER